MVIHDGRGRIGHWLAVFALAAFVMSIPSENGITVPGFGSLSRLIGLTAFGMGAASLVHNGALHARRLSLFVLVAFLFVLWASATLFWSYAPAQTFVGIFTFAQLFVLVWLTWQFCRGPTETAILLQAFVFGCYLTISSALFAFFGSDAPAFRDVGGLNPNAFSIAVALAIPMAWRLAFHWKSPLLVWLNLIYPLFAIFAVVIAASRGGLITALVSLTIIPLTLHRLSITKRVLVFLLIAGALWTAFVQAPQLFPELQRNLERLSTTTEELSGGTLTGRTTIWAAGLELFGSSPVVGIGVGTFHVAVTPILGKSMHPHNAFLEVAVESGLVGLLLYVALIGLAAMASISARGRQRVFLIVLFTALLAGMAPTNSSDGKFVWFLLALIASQNPIVLLSSGVRVIETARMHEHRA